MTALASLFASVTAHLTAVPPEAVAPLLWNALLLLALRAGIRARDRRMVGSAADRVGPRHDEFRSAA